MRSLSAGDNAGLWGWGGGGLTHPVSHVEVAASVPSLVIKKRKCAQGF